MFSLPLLSSPSVRRATVLLLVAVLLAALLPAPATHAANFNAASFTDLVNAINQANSLTGDDTITITADITLTGPLPAISSNMALIGGGNTISGDNLYRVFVVNSGTVSFTNLTIANARARGGNGGFGVGGGGGGAAGFGGGLLIIDGNATVDSMTFVNNQVIGGNGGNQACCGPRSGGGGGGSGGNGSDGSAGGGGSGGDGAPFGGSGGSGGTPNGGSGGPGAGGGGGSGATGNFGGNGGFGGGGGGGGPSDGGNGGFGGGGGGRGSGGFGGGSAPGTSGDSGGGGGAGMGGAIFINSGTLIINNSTLSDNTATGGSGGSGFGNGEAGQGLGGGVFIRNGAVTITNSTIAANIAANGGGGIYTLADNAAATLSLRGSIVANSTGAVTDCVVNTINGGTATPTGVNNLITNNGGCTGVTVTANPVLGALANNGGATQTMALGTGSPAINAANPAFCPATDQRGLPRRAAQGFCDIGAFEAQPAAIATQAGSSQSTAINTAFASALQIRVTNAGGNALGGVIVSFSAPPSGASATLSGATAITDAQGQASVTATANSTPGSYIVTANAAGVATAASFTLTNTVRIYIPLLRRP